MAWEYMVYITDKYNSMRGEMHDLFDQIGASGDSLDFKVRLDAIWGTWGFVEEAMKKQPSTLNGR